MKGYQTHKELVTNRNGRTEYVHPDMELEYNDLVAEIKVVTKDGREVSRDQFVSDDSWIRYEEYLISTNI